MTIQKDEAGLLDTLRRLVDHLRAYGGGEWTGHFEECLRRLQRASRRDHKRSVCASIRGVYGGMGSFNDWVVEPTDKNVELEALRRRVYELSLTFEDRLDD